MWPGRRTKGLLGMGGFVIVVGVGGAFGGEPGSGGAGDLIAWII